MKKPPELCRRCGEHVVCRDRFCGMDWRRYALELEAAIERATAQFKEALQP